MRGSHGTPHGDDASETDLDKLLVDAIRGLMGLAPLYDAEGRLTDTQRFGSTRPGWWRHDGMTSRKVGDSI